LLRRVFDSENLHRPKVCQYAIKHDVVGMYHQFADVFKTAGATEFRVVRQGFHLVTYFFAEAAIPANAWSYLKSC
jgi:hypothetical protein